MCSSKRIKGENCGNRSIGIDLLEELVWTWVFMQGQFQNILIEHFQNNTHKKKEFELNARLERLHKNEQKHRKNLKELIEMKLEGEIAKEVLNEKIAEIEETQEKTTKEHRS